MIRVFIISLALSHAASGALNFTMQEVGNDVVVTTTGTLVNPLASSGDIGDSNDIDLLGPGNIGATSPLVGSLSVGRVQLNAAYITIFYENVFVSGPDNFGPGITAEATSSSGNYLGFVAASGSVAVDIVVREQLVPLTGGTATWANTTIANLGATPGVYTWQLNHRFENDTITLRVIPEPSSSGLLMLGAIAAGIFGRRRRS
jgi:hypothetical protein